MPQQYVCLLVVLVAMIATPSTTALAQSADGVPVHVARVVEESVASGNAFVGTVTPLRRAVIGSAVDGRVVRFPLREGMRVEAGGTLAQLLTETISLELRAAKAELDLRQEELNELKAGSRSQEIAQAKALMESARAAEDLAKSNLRRTQELYNRGATTENSLEIARAEAANARETFREREAAFHLVEEGPRTEQIAQAAARVAIQDALVRRLEDQIAKHTIISRFDGIVVAEHTEEGQWVKQGDLVAEVVALDEVIVRVQVLESQIPHIAKNDPVTVIVPALPDQVFEGYVEQIVPQADVRARTFPVRIRVANHLHDGVPELKSGMLARATLATGPRVQAMLVPKDALILGGPRPRIAVLTSDDPQAASSTVRLVPVELGISTDGLIQVTGDVKADQRVVIRGNERLREGQPVRVIHTHVPAPSVSQAP